MAGMSLTPPNPPNVPRVSFSSNISCLDNFTRCDSINNAYDKSICIQQASLNNCGQLSLGLPQQSMNTTATIYTTSTGQNVRNKNNAPLIKNIVISNS